MITREFKIEGMSCMHCVMAVKNAVKQFNPESLEVEIGHMKITFDETETDDSKISAAVEEEGYKVVEIK